MLLRPGNAGSNTVADHLQVVTNAVAQLPPQRRAKILIRIDGAGAIHELLEHLHALNTSHRTVRFTVGWAITATDEAAIAALSPQAWAASLDQDGQPNVEAHTAGLTGLSQRGGWVAGMRLLVRRT